MNLRVRQEGNVIIVQPDTPYFKSYRVNYVNMERASESRIATFRGRLPSADADRPRCVFITRESMAAPTGANRSGGTRQEATTMPSGSVRQRNPVLARCRRSVSSSVS